jgi:hypothetical protein
MKLLQFKPLFKKGGGSEALTQDTILTWTIKSGSVEHEAKLEVTFSSCLLKLFWSEAVTRKQMVGLD